MEDTYLNFFKQMLDDDHGITMDAADMALRLADRGQFGSESVDIIDLLLNQVDSGEGRVFLQEKRK